MLRAICCPFVRVVPQYTEVIHHSLMVVSVFVLATWCIVPVEFACILAATDPNLWHLQLVGDVLLCLWSGNALLFFLMCHASIDGFH